MNYEKISFEIKSILPTEDGSADFSVGIITGIVGNIYPQFIAGDLLKVTISSFSTKTGLEIQQLLDIAVNDFVSSKYFNT